MYFSTKLKKNHLFQEKTAFCTNSLPFRPEFRGGFFMQNAFQALSTVDLF